MRECFVHVWGLSKKGKESLQFPRSAGVWLCVPSILSLYLFLLPVFIQTHVLLHFKPFLSFVTSLLLFECFFFWWLVESGNVRHFPHKQIQNKLSHCGLSWPHEIIFAPSKYSSSFCPFDYKCPKECHTNPSLLSKWRLVCFIFDWSTQIILTG